MFCLFFTPDPVIDLASAKRSDRDKIRAFFQGLPRARHLFRALAIRDRISFHRASAPMLERRRESCAKPWRIVEAGERLHVVTAAGTGRCRKSLRHRRRPGLGKLRCELHFPGPDSRRREIFLRRRSEVLRQRRHLRAIQTGRGRPLSRHARTGGARSRADARIGIERRSHLSSARRAGFSIAARRRECASSSLCRGRNMSSFCVERTARHEIVRVGSDAVAKCTPGIRRSSVISSATKSQPRWCAGWACGA